MKPITVIIFSALALVLAAGTASAQAGDVSFELYGGVYSPSGGLDDELTYGLRGGYRATNAFGLEASVGRFDISQPPVELDVILVDLSFKGYLNSGSKAEVFLFGGPGWAFIDANAFGNTVFSDDSLTLHAGIGVDISLGQHVYLRPDVRGRWFEKSASNDVDVEASLALGFTF